jgi:tRNA(Leu) C34 or U34 (ribose-2'-O)-methylase TrmL
LGIRGSAGTQILGRVSGGSINERVSLLFYTTARYQEEHYLVFGPETRGLPQDLLEANPESSYRIPMAGAGVRSLNLSNAVSIVLYEGLRQLGKA